MEYPGGLGVSHSDDLFSTAPVKNPELITAPLAHRMRPLNLDEIAGHERVIAVGRPLRTWIEADRLPSLIFWGPPGCGKTTLARVISEKTRSRFVSMSAVLSGVKDIKEAVEQAKSWRSRGARTLLFVDEIHRFNKSQQDALLPHVEDGTVTLIGATTENPSFELNSALLSRTRVIRLERVSSEAIQKVLTKALSDTERGLAGLLHLSIEALAWIADGSEGDVRRALTALETVALNAQGEGGQEISLEVVQEILSTSGSRQPLPYDKDGEEHHNVVSAFIKSLRDSDPHAGLYYLARMLEAGEDPLFISRRLVIFASEDVGNADPRGLQIALAAKDAVDFVGMPEARINLAQAVTYLACAPKSNASYEGINQAIAEVRKSGALSVPFHLRNAPTSLMKREGYGKGYQYAHASKGARVQQTHLPDPLVGRRFYEPKDSGYEKQLKLRLDELNSNFEK